MSTKPERLAILGTFVDNLTSTEFIQSLEYLIQKKEKQLVCPVNINVLNLAYKHPWLRDFINSAKIVHIDGTGANWGALLYGKKMKPRIATADIIYEICEKWQNQPFSIYFLGGPEGQAQEAKEKLEERYPGVRIVGTWRGHLSEKEDLEAIEDINTKKPDILMVGFGTPYQEEWILKYREKIDCQVFWPVGAVTSYISQRVPRAPWIFKKLGMEWFFRLMLEPRSKFNRYVIGNPLFFLRILKERLALSKKQT